MKSSDFKLEARKNLQGKWGNAIGMVFTYFLIFLVLNFISNIFPNNGLKIVFELLILIIEIPLMFGLTFSFLNLYRTNDTFSFNFLEFLELGFSNFKRSWAIKWHTFLKLLLPAILLFILMVIASYTGLMGFYYLLGSVNNIAYSSTSSNYFILTFVTMIALCVVSIWLTIKSYYYVLADLIAMDNPDMSAKEAVQKSEDLMEGNRLKLFYLHLSFIGLILLFYIIFSIVLGFFIPDVVLTYVLYFVLIVSLLWLIPYMSFANISFYMFVIGKNNSIDVSDNNNINSDVNNDSAIGNNDFNNNTDIM